MKIKKGYIRFFPLLSICLFSCVNQKNVNSFIYYKVAEECISMGVIEGEQRQNPLVGDYTSVVTAKANEGYIFLKWDDGFLEASRFDLSTEVSPVVYIAYLGVIDE